MGIEGWAAAHGEKPRAANAVANWFAEHEDVRQEARGARAHGWSWRQITDYLTDEHGFPFRDSESVSKECS